MMADDSVPKPSRSDKKSQKKHKRHHEADGAEGSERKHKKSKSSANVPSSVTETPAQIEATLSKPPTSQPKENSNDSTAQKKKKKRKHESRSTDIVDEEQNGAADSTPKKEKKSKERKKKHKRVDVNGDAPQSSPVPNSQVQAADEQEEASEPEAMDIDATPADTTHLREFGQKPDNKKYPFFTQTVSQYLPLFPSGLIEPIEGFADQHLRPLLNRYVPNFRGVLLAYRSPRVGEAPGKGSLTEESAMEDVVLLESINEYAVNFGWLTVEVDLFRPTRGAWMEGSVNLQGEGHIGVVCWDMFNASIEAARLPRGWRWVDLLSKDKETAKSKGKKNDGKKTAEEAKLPTPEPLEDQENDETQIHTTGYWVDETGARIRGGAKFYFRIKHYEVGISGDYGYISIEGTMLNEKEEKAKYTEEMEVLRRRRLKHGGRKEQKRLPEFSMTKFAANEADDNEAQRAPVEWVASRPDNDTD